MNIEQIENFNKINFPYKIETIGKFLYLKKYELDNIIQGSNATYEIDLCNCTKSTVFMAQTDTIHSLIIKNNVLFINTLLEDSHV